jgi:hypothetical protein
LHELGEQTPVLELEPFDALLDFEAEWSFDFDGTSRDGDDSSRRKPSNLPVFGHASGTRVSLRERALDPAEAIQLDPLRATSTDVDLQATFELEYGGADALRGRASYELSSRVARVRVVDGFDPDAGKTVPATTVWSCAD